MAAYVPWSQKRLRLTKQVVALDLKMSDELFQAALAHVWDASREVKAVRQINSDRGLKSQEPDVLRKALKAGRIKRCRGVVAGDCQAAAPSLPCVPR